MKVDYQVLCLAATFVVGLAVVNLTVARAARAGNLTVHLGPPSIGNGGSNPLSIPPVNPLEYEVTYITDAGFETNIAISPGILLGKRTYFGSGAYTGLGAGLVLDFNGGGPGVYASIGVDLGPKDQSIRFNAEFKQALGYSGGKAISPYALRIGATFHFF